MTHHQTQLIIAAHNCHTDLPVGRYGHWMVTLHDGRVMIIGAGDPSSLRQNVLIYDSSTNTFTAGPDTIYSVLQIYVLYIKIGD